jgi:hypothetical protein
MRKKRVELPTVRVLDEWAGEVDGYAFVYRIKETSGGGKPTWYPVSYWREGEPRLSTGGAFDERPTRQQVEEHFASSIKNFIRVHIEKRFDG